MWEQSRRRFTERRPLNLAKDESARPASDEAEPLGPWRPGKDSVAVGVVLGVRLTSSLVACM